ncbi:hypothetical protein DVR12_22495 [Chitinophaga silvatica]|uniref:Uncharacterized protein n=1 Tax=Chitinophaga silvatica TaxID=2282649 RepID=A0A3E1Y4L0_9BACT|nr:hypothetical protein [Chitinophaga silvatica]RFS19407.1 hypothetical protein DVR12_22495 [Chitinophaga silvatica]
MRPYLKMTIIFCLTLSKFTIAQQNRALYKVVKIDSVENVYTIYISRNDSIFKICSQKNGSNICNNLIVVGKHYPFILKSIVAKSINGVSLMNVNRFITAIDFYGTTIEFDTITTEKDIYISGNLKGLCFQKEPLPNYKLYGPPPSNLSTRDFIYNKVSKNVFVYNIRNASNSFNGAKPEDILEMGTEYYTSLLPDPGYGLIMSIDTMNLEYPIKNFKVYKIFINGFEYEKGQVHSKTNYLFLENNFLVAIDTSDNYPGYIKYISGQFYPTRISEDFKIDLNNPSSCLDYLKFRMYIHQVDSIKFERRVKEGLIFTGYSQTKKSKVEILLKKKDLERPIILRYPS